MITFVSSILFLFFGYQLYGRLLERVFGIDLNHKVPSETHFDGVDFLPLHWVKGFLIQLLNIAGLGPVFGAILGALWGPVAFVWIILGGIFIGGVHDFVAGFMSLRHAGAGLPELIGRYLGSLTRKLMVALTMVLLVVVGVIFAVGPARLIADFITMGIGPETIAEKGAAFYINPVFWTILIFLYYFMATMLPFDKIIGRFYPIFGASLLAMVFLMTYHILIGNFVVPELTFANLHPTGRPIWPIMMITIACGAISGFHATQAPMIARTLTSERLACRVFYGAMLTETFIALVWAAAAMGLCHGSSQELLEIIGPNGDAVLVVKALALKLGQAGFVLALLGVVALPITTGDTAFRAARLILAECFGLEQKTIRGRLLLSIPLFLIAISMTGMKFGKLWQYLSWLNQALAGFTLWAATVFLKQNQRNYLITAIPAIFMTGVTFAYILVEDKIGFGLAYNLANPIALAFTVLTITLVFLTKFK